MSRSFNVFASRRFLGVALAIALVSFALQTVVGLAATAPASVSVTDFGAAPDDGRDDAVAIQRALDAVAVGGTVVIPDGEFSLGVSAGGVEAFPNGDLVQSALILRQDEVTIRGTGQRSTLKLLPSTKMRVLTITSKSVVVEGIFVDGNRSERDGSEPWPGGDVVDALVYANATAEDVTVRDCRVEEGVEDGIGFWRSRNVAVERCVIRNNGTRWAGASGVALSGVAGGAVVDSRLSGNSGAGVWVRLGSSGIKIDSNVVRRNGRDGVAIQHSSAVVTGNTIARNGRRGFAGISIVSAHDGVVRSNAVRDNHYVGIQVVGSSELRARGWRIVSNICSNAKTALQDAGIAIGPHSFGIDLRRNRCINNGNALLDQIRVADAASVNADWRSSNHVRFRREAASPRWLLPAAVAAGSAALAFAGRAIAKGG